MILRVESLAIGLPVVSSDCGGMKEVIENGRNGFIYPARDIVSLQNLLLKIIELGINERKEIELNIRHFSNAIFITRKVILFGLSFTLLTSFSFLIFFIYSQN